MYGLWGRRPPKPYILSYFYDFFKSCYSVNICPNILKLNKFTNFSVIFHVMFLNWINISALGPIPFLNSEMANKLLCLKDFPNVSLSSVIQ
jgi:hypothetical protein